MLKTEVKARPDWALFARCVGGPCEGREVWGERGVRGEGRWV